MSERYRIITFYGFKDMALAGDLLSIRESLRLAMRRVDIVGTIIIADEGFNGTVCGKVENIPTFVNQAESILSTRLDLKSSFHDELPFRKIEVKIKPEIVTLRKKVEISIDDRTHVKAADWNEIISDPEVYVLDTRNDYEFKSGSFRRAVNPGTVKFSDLPKFVEANLDPEKHKKIALYCTGGIRCEKFSPYMKSLGFENVYQLEGGILKYLEEIPVEQQLWQGECFVFDHRRTVDEKLRMGTGPDFSQKLLDINQPE